MDDNKLRIFSAISSFINDLNSGFGKKYKPVALYNRLIEKTTNNDLIAIDRHISAFRSFFNKNLTYIKGEKLEKNARIEYSERVYLDVGTILHKLDKEDKKHIHTHLITIYSLMNLGSREGKEALETLKSKNETNKGLNLNLPNTTEGDFLKETLNEMTSQFTDMNLDENSEINPMSMMTNMMQSGFFTKFMGDLQNKFDSGEVNLASLMKTVTSTISELAPEAEGEDSSNIQNFVKQSMEQVETITGGQDLPSELKGQMEELLKAVGSTKNN